jgi:hypothetical protein
MRMIGTGLAIVLAISAPAVSVRAAAPHAINTQIYTTYNFYDNNSQISWVTCGSTQQSEGCFDSGRITGFGKVCSVLDTVPEVNGAITRQKLYIFDSDVSGGANLVLSVYEKTDVTTESFDTTTFKLTSKVTLQIPAGPGVRCFAVGTHGDGGGGLGYIFAGTSTSDSAVRISKADLSVTPIGGFSPPIPVTSIDIDPADYVSVNFGNGNNTGFILFAPSGGGAGDGGGNAVIFDNRIGYTP